MRDIEFRAIDAETGRMIHGSLFLWKDGHCEICTNERASEDQTICDKRTVIRETVCEYTGLEASRMRLFEGDIVRYKRTGTIGQILFNDGHFVLKWNKYNDYFVSIITFIDELEIIGNIHMNPELLKEAA